MFTLILLLCSIPPLAVMTVAGIHGFRTGNSTVLTTLLLSILIVSGSAVLPHMRDKQPVPTVRFATPEGDVAKPYHFDDPVRLARRWDMNETHR